MLSLMVLMGFASIASAVAVEERTINFTVSEVPGLIAVSTDLNTTNLLPGFEYHYTLSVRWGVPNESLRAIATDRIKIYINIHPVNNDTFIYFKKGGEKQQQCFFALECIVENNSCSNASTLSKDVEVYYLLTPGANVSVEQLAISASLSPFANDETVREVNTIISRLSKENLTANLSRRLDDARRMADDGDYESARKELNEIVSSLPASQAPSPSPTDSGNSDGWNLLLGAIIALIALLAVALLAAYLSKRGKRSSGFEALEEHEIKGSDYAEEPQTPPESMEYKPPERKEEPPVVQRVPDWLG